MVIVPSLHLTLSCDMDARVTTGSDVTSNRSRVWVRRILAGSFLFFLIKGLIWLGVLAFAASQLS